jgi:type IV pilus assembly protein PilE
MKKMNGFTLVELMIVVAIIGILSAIAIPTYNEYILRGRIPDATNNLMAQRIAMEQYFQDYRQFTTAAAPAPASPCAAVQATRYFTYACGNWAATTYTITATGVGSMANFVYTIDQSATRTTVSLGGGWPQPVQPSTCWAIKKDLSC